MIPMRRVNSAKAVQSVKRRLDNNVVGYAFALGNGSQTPPTIAIGGLFDAAGGLDYKGLARTAANPPVTPITASTKFCIHSATKMLTALAVVSLLDEDNTPGSNHTLSSPIGPFLPKKWTVPAQVADITFGQILTFTAGINKGNVLGTYQFLEQYFGSGVAPQFDQYNAPSDYNGNEILFDLLRIILPALAGMPDPTVAYPNKNSAYYAQWYLDEFINTINKQVFFPVGGVGVSTEISGTQTEAFAYKYPGSTTGYQWSTFGIPPGPNDPVSLGEASAGAGSLLASLEDLCPVLQDLCNGGKKIFPRPWKNISQWDQMRSWNTMQKDKNGQTYYYPVGMGGQQYVQGAGSTILCLPVLHSQDGTPYRKLAMDGGAGDPKNLGTSMTAYIGVFGSATSEPIVADGPFCGALLNGPVYGVLLANSDIVNSDVVTALDQAILDSLEPVPVGTPVPLIPQGSVTPPPPPTSPGELTPPEPIQVPSGSHTQ